MAAPPSVVAALPDDSSFADRLLTHEPLGLSPAVSSDQPAGFWHRVARYIPAVAQALGPIGAQLAAAGGNYKPLEFQMQQQDMANRRALLASQLQSADLSRQFTQKELENYQTPAQRQQGQLDTLQKQLQLQRQYAEPQDIVGAIEGQPGQLGHFQRTYNPATQGYDVTPTMVSHETTVSTPENPQVPYDPTKTVTRTDQRQLLAAPKSAGAALVEPDTNSPTGYAHVWRDAKGNEVGRAAGALPPAAFLPKQTTSNSTKVIQTPDGYATVPVTNSSTSGPAIPWLTPPQAARTSGAGAGSAKPLTDASGNQLQPALTSSTRTMREAAPEVLKFIARIEPLVQANVGNMGPVGGRWADFWNNKVGAPDASYTALRSNDALLSTLLMRMHVGARGGEHMQQHFQDLLALAHTSPENYEAALQQIKAYAQDLTQQPGGHRNTPPAGAIVIQLDDFLNQK